MSIRPILAIRQSFLSAFRTKHMIEMWSPSPSVAILHNESIFVSNILRISMAVLVASCPILCRSHLFGSCCSTGTTELKQCESVATCCQSQNKHGRPQHPAPNRSKCQCFCDGALATKLSLVRIELTSATNDFGHVNALDIGARQYVLPVDESPPLYGGRQTRIWHSSLTC